MLDAHNPASKMAHIGRHNPLKNSNRRLKTDIESMQVTSFFVSLTIPTLSPSLSILSLPINQTPVASPFAASSALIGRLAASAANPREAVMLIGMMNQTTPPTR